MKAYPSAWAPRCILQVLYSHAACKDMRVDEKFTVTFDVPFYINKKYYSQYS